ncbi:hypothetical protein [Anaeroselena agilis]|uniref:Uncharacterized protein n=1 Tax=Anaeroselena agilis TaxID=3063788 RepID=A0ABU3NZJ9_9FIRM|nr:hypothetical protein [Selenomonadales bacterium 4137-cl]
MEKHDHVFLLRPCQQNVCIHCEKTRDQIKIEELRAQIAAMRNCGNCSIRPENFDDLDDMIAICQNCRDENDNVTLKEWQWEGAGHA